MASVPGPCMASARWPAPACGRLRDGGRPGDHLDALDHCQARALVHAHMRFDDPQRQPAGGERLGALERRAPHLLRPGDRPGVVRRGAHGPGRLSGAFWNARDPIPSCSRLAGTARSTHFKVALTAMGFPPCGRDGVESLIGAALTGVVAAPRLSGGAARALRRPLRLFRGHRRHRLAGQVHAQGARDRPGAAQHLAHDPGSDVQCVPHVVINPDFQRPHGRAFRVKRRGVAL